MHIILISGKAEAGKSTTARMLDWFLNQRGFKTVVIPYGDYVKHTARLLWKWNGKKDDEGRDLLQWWGTDYVRALKPDFWAETVTRLAEVIQGQVDYVIVDDVRFPNEIDIWNGYNFTTTLVRVERPGHENALTPEQRQHISEMALDNWPHDIVLEATNEIELQYQVDVKLIKYLLELRNPMDSDYIKLEFINPNDIREKHGISTEVEKGV